MTEPMTLAELDALFEQDQAYLAAERELRPALNLGNDVLDFRVDVGWTQVDLARAVGTNQANISRLESALANPTLGFLKKVARALGAELDVRLRRPEDLPANETLQAFVTMFDAGATTVTEKAVIFTAVSEGDPIYQVDTRTSTHC